MSQISLTTLSHRKLTKKKLKVEISLDNETVKTACMIKEMRRDLKMQIEKSQSAHADYVICMDYTSAANQVGWIKETKEKFSSINQKC